MPAANPVAVNLLVWLLCALPATAGAWLDTARLERQHIRGRVPRWWTLARTGWGRDASWGSFHVSRWGGAMGHSTLKVCTLVALPPEVNTVRGPVCAQGGANAVRLPSAFTVATATQAAPNATEGGGPGGGGARFVSMMVTAVPTGPL